MRRYAHAESDSLEHSTVVSHADLYLSKMLARCLLDGEPELQSVTDRCGQILGRRWRWLGPLVRRYLKAFTGRTRPRQRDVVRFLQQDDGFQRAWSKYYDELSVTCRLGESLQMRPVQAAQEWEIPAITSVGALSEWLGVKTSEAEWFADLKGLAYRRSNPKVCHYHYRVLAKANSGVRLIESPKLRLKKMQRQILTSILEKIPIHRVAHGFVKGRSIKTFVAPHVKQRVVLRMDLQDYFPSFRSARIQALFRTLGYPGRVADLLGGICTNAVPRRVWRATSSVIDLPQLQEARSLYSRTHLPQGAPTSPALANLCTYRVDRRLAGLARSVGAAYTRYADDLAFSGDELFERRVEGFSTHVAAILIEEGFSVNHRKTRIMRRGVRQHLAGLVTNQHANIIRGDFDRLKATLTNCVRSGPDSQNREALPRFQMHLEGRVAFVESINPAKGLRLRKIFEQIRWS